VTKFGVDRALRMLAERLSIKPSKAAVSIDIDQGP
jgi:hypothetical protein